MYGINSDDAVCPYHVTQKSTHGHQCQSIRILQRKMEGNRQTERPMWKNRMWLIFMTVNKTARRAQQGLWLWIDLLGTWWRRRGAIGSRLAFGHPAITWYLHLDFKCPHRVIAGITLGVNLQTLFFSMLVALTYKNIDRFDTIRRRPSFGTKPQWSIFSTQVKERLERSRTNYRQKRDVIRRKKNSNSFTWNRDPSFRHPQGKK